MEKNVFDFAEDELITSGFEYDEIEPSKNNQTETLFTKTEEDTLYIAWYIKKFQPFRPDEWYLGILPVSDLEGTRGEERLEIIARACTIKAETNEVEGILENLRRSNRFQLPSQYQDRRQARKSL